VIILVIVAALVLIPAIAPGAKVLNTSAKICVFVVLVASYDLVLGYAGIASFAHAMFFGIGSYSIALAVIHLGPTWQAVAVGVLAGILLNFFIAAMLALFSLRVRAFFFSMVTLAFAAAALVFASQMSAITGGEDGLVFTLPHSLTRLRGEATISVLGFPLTQEQILYYGLLIVCAVLFLLIVRVVHSPFGAVLQAIRENEFRAKALGYNTFRHVIAVTCLSACIAGIAGSLNALWLKYVGPDTALSFAIAINILIMVVIGGMGTLYGSIIGAAVVLLAEGYLKGALAWMSAALPNVPVMTNLLAPDRWLLWLGLAYIVSVHVFPGGIAGTLQRRAVGERGRRPSTAPTTSTQTEKPFIVDVEPPAAMN
jgi:branched-chain amino acid transport system permease protein